MIRIVAVLLACLFASTADASVGAVSFVGLRNGDTLWIKYESSGCFHSYRADFTLYGREPNVAHLQLWNFGIAGRTDGPVARTVRLTNEDLLALDSLVGSSASRLPRFPLLRNTSPSPRAVRGAEPPWISRTYHPD